MNNAILSRFNLLNAVQRLSCASRWLFFRGPGDFRTPLLRSAYTTGTFPGVWRLPASSSVSLSISTAMLAIGLLFTGPLSDAIGRKPVMVTALLLASCCTLLSTMMTSWHGILIMRALIGLSLSGVAAVGMTYLSEEIHPSFVAFSMGLYISGNSIGGMSGRLLSGVMTDFLTGASRWRPSDALRWRPR